MTTRTTNHPEPPAWFNIDAVVPPALQDEMWQLADEVDALLPRVRELAQRTHDAISRYDAGRKHLVDWDEGPRGPDRGVEIDISDGVAALLSYFSGVHRLFYAWVAIENEAVAGRCEPNPDAPPWVEENERTEGAA